MSAGIKFFAGSASQDLAARIAAVSGKELGSLELAKFSDGEFQPRITETVRGQDVFIIQSTFPP
ncbi:MAG: ribose-phosphate pyrophosphokinase-like domain-containing protein, partial [Flavobacteriales bacterium]|nr:ribose-phosphate pyrophosphokinase-like domain-containing protein [Flavobacteriales bacterium]